MRRGGGLGARRGAYSTQDGGREGAFASSWRGLRGSTDHVALDDLNNAHAIAGACYTQAEAIETAGALRCC